MQVTDEQIEVIREYNRLDEDYIQRQELRAELSQMKSAVRQMAQKDVVFLPEMQKLEEAFPGMIDLFAGSMNYSVEEFNEQLIKGITLSSNLKNVLEQLLNDALLWS